MTKVDFFLVAARVLVRTLQCADQVARVLVCQRSLGVGATGLEGGNGQVNDCLGSLSKYRA